MDNLPPLPITYFMKLNQDEKEAQYNPSYRETIELPQELLEESYIHSDFIDQLTFTDYNYYYYEYDEDEEQYDSYSDTESHNDEIF